MVKTVCSISFTLAEEPERADVHLLQAGLHKVAAGVDVVIRELLFHLANAQAVRHQLVGIHAHLIFPRRAPEGADVNNVGNGLEFLHHGPILDRPQIHDVNLRVGTFQHIPIDLSRRTPVRAHGGLKALGQISLSHPLHDLLPVPVIVGGVVEDHQHERQAENRFRPEMREMRNSIHLDFDRNRDLLLHLLGGPAGPLRDDGCVVVRDIGIGLDGQVMKRDRLPSRAPGSRAPAPRTGC